MAGVRGLDHQVAMVIMDSMAVAIVILYARMGILMGSNIIEGTPGTKSYRPEDWEMPEVLVGMTVLWSYNTGSEASPAIVVGVGHRSVALHVHVKDVKDHVIKTGTRHVGDPFLQKFPQHEGGCWRHTEFNERILAMLADYEEEVVDEDDDVPEEE